MTEQTVETLYLGSNGITSESSQRMVVLEPDSIWQGLTKANFPKDNIQFCGGCGRDACIGCEGAWEILLREKIDTLLIGSSKPGDKEARLVKRIRGEKISLQPVVVIYSEGAELVLAEEERKLEESGVDVLVGVGCGYPLLRSVVNSSRSLKESLSRFGPLLTESQVEEATRQLSRPRMLAS